MSKPTRDQADRFLSDLEWLCRQHGLSLAHQDGQGAFIVTEYREPLLRWLKAAQVQSVEETEADVGWSLEDGRWRTREER